MSERIRYRRRRAVAVLRFNPWNCDAEPGDLMVGSEGSLVRLESARTSAAAAGELYPRLIHPPKRGMLAAIIDGEVWWLWPPDWRLVPS